MVARKELMDWPIGAHGTTFGGNPVSCAAARATIEVIEEEGLVENAAKMGERLLTAVGGMMSRHEAIGEVRGRGLVVGVELVKDRQTREPAPELRDDIIARAFRKGLLMLGCGLSTVRFMPALTIDADTVDAGLAIFEEALTEAEGRS
jgi:4-aminobutyrate aminotransferase